jgi:hypothetical protein
MIPSGPTYGMAQMLEAAERVEQLQARRKSRRKAAGPLHNS